jgi:cobalt-zinc-cadmium efflux system outer membrane protein
MHHTGTPVAGPWPHAARATPKSAVARALAAVLLGAAIQAQAQPHATPAGTDRPGLRAAFEAAWARQPEAQALAARRDAASAQQQAALALTPEPVAMALSSKTDRLNRKLGAREHELGVAIPLWLPGERGSSQALAAAEARAIESRSTAAQLRVAAAVREAWWAWQRARVERDAARGQLDNVRRIAADVGKRLKAGDLARADLHQAEGAVAAAEASVAGAEGAFTATLQQLRSLMAMPARAAEGDASNTDAEPEPEPPTAASAADELDSHADLLALRDRSAVAEGLAALAATQSRANPELTIATTRDRGSRGDATQQSVTVGVRIPFGAGPRHAARVASARAEAVELQAQLGLERARLAGEREAASARTGAARAQLAAAERRAHLARASRGFFEKSFRLGETDLPTRLRIEAEAADAERQALRARIELAAAVSAWRQALGLLPQ